MCELILSDGDRIVGYLIEDATGALRVCLPLAAANDRTVELEDPPEHLRSALVPERLRSALRPPPAPCDWCGTRTHPTDTGRRFCSDQCRSDADTQMRAGRRDRIASLREPAVCVPYPPFVEDV